MQKKLLKALVMTMFIPILMRAEWIPLNNQKPSPTPPNVTLISDDNNSTVMKIEISGFEQQDFVSNDRQYQLIDLLSESFTNNPGFPELPYVAKVLAIPDFASVSVEVLETGEVQTFENIYLPPARESWLEGSPEPLYTEVTTAYSSTNAYPHEWVQLDKPSVFRDFRITRVSVFPVRYNAVKKELQVVSSITVRINYSTGEVINPKTTATKPIAPSFGDLYRDFIFNYQSVLNKSYGGKESAHELMLCIMPDAFVAGFQTYAEWKRRSGIDIHITKFSDIGANATNQDIIKTHITDAYFNWDVPPTYVLIVGDNGVFPHTTANGYVSENFFVEIDGNDYFPELLLGRFTNESDYGMQVMINKMLKYEKTPYTANTNWFKKGICCSNNAYPSQAQTKRFAAERMLQDGGFISVDTMMMPASGCPYTLTDVKNAINNGRSFLNYRGEGWYSGWWAGCYQFGTSDVTTLANGEKFTFVTSIGCGVANFTSTSTGNCFGEEWVELGTLSSPKGAIAFAGPTGNTHTAYNNNIDRGIYKGMFQEGLETPGQALLRGKLFMYNVFGGGDSYVSYHFKIYCTLGDPSIHIWKDIPKAVTVNYPTSIPFGNNLVDFAVTHTATGLPVANALVCVTGYNIFSTCYTDETGHAFLEVNSLVEETLKVTVRGGNVIPFLGTMEVLQPTGAYIVKDSYTINDVAGGNGNGLLDYGETNLLSLTVKNVGIQQAENVVVKLYTNDTFITLTDSTAYYGSIAAGSTAVVSDGFAYTVSNNIPDLHLVLIEVKAITTDDIWVSYVSIGAHAPVIEYMNFVVSDPTGNNNGKLDPGETANILITIKNSGSSGAFNVIGILTENDPFITINSSQMNFGNIAAGALSNAVYSVNAASNSPAGHIAGFTLALNADLGITGTGEFQIVIGQIPVLIVDLDDNLNSAPAMETALNFMDVAHETLYSLPSDLNLYSTIFVCLGIYPYNHQLTSAQGQSLANYLNNGGSLYMEGGDTWYFDPDTPVHAMFNINPTADGGSDMNTVSGKAGTFTAGMSFNYNGENSWMDHIEPIAPAYKILENQSPLYGTGVAYDAEAYKTIGTSHEFGGLTDGASPSTKAELMAAYLEFFGVSFSVQAIFNSNVTMVCENNMVNFFDQSSGNVISWEWTFEGGSPAVSNEQNPSVLYSIPGSYDVSLTVSDGNENSTLLMNDYIVVNSLPVAPSAPTGPTAVCASEGNSEYSTTGLTGITTYHWLLEPSEAGIITGTNLAAVVIWANGFLGDATLKVAGENICGTGPYSNPIIISRYLPEVNLDPFEWVCIGWPSIELTGGMPEGGVFTGPGVENGWFNPSAANIGTHTITYTYSDTNNCENYDTETILVDPCTGLNDVSDLSGIKIYPNPSSGLITIGSVQNTGAVEILVMNTLNKVVYNESAEMLPGEVLNIDLSKLRKGVYFIRILTDKKEETKKIILQ